MIPAPFDYVRAGSTDEVVAALAQHGDEAKIIAGGMSLLPLMKLRLATPTVLVDVARVPDLSYVRDAGDHLAIGALTRHRDVEVPEVAVGAHELRGLDGEPALHPLLVGRGGAHDQPGGDGSRYSRQGPL